MMRHLPKIVGMILAGLAGTAKAQPPGGPQRPPDPILVLASDTVTLPMTLFGGRPQLELKVNGKGNHPFILDTAAGGGRISTKMAMDLGLTPIGEAALRSGVGEPVRAKLYKLDSLAAPGLEIRDLVVVAADMPGGDLPPALPVSAFSKVLLTVDFPAGKIVLEKGELPPADGQTILDYEGRLQSFPASLGGVAITLHPDSGSGGGISVSRELADKLPLAAPPQAKGKGRTLNAEFDILEAQLKGNAQFGKFVFENPTLSIVEGLREPLIGSELLQRFALVLDQKNRRIRFVEKGSGS